MQREPRASIQCLFDLPREPNTDQKLQYIAFYYWDDDSSADVAWIFTICEEDDLTEALQRYAFGLRRDTADEYACAFQRFVTYLAVQELLLDNQKPRDQNPGSHDTSGNGSHNR